MFHYLCPSHNTGLFLAIRKSNGWFTWHHVVVVVVGIGDGVFVGFRLVSFQRVVSNRTKRRPEQLFLIEKDLLL